MEKEQDIGFEIDIVGLLFVLLKRWWLILLAAVVCGSGMFVYTKFMVTPMYRSVAKLYVLPTTDEKQLNASDAQMALSFTKDFQVVATGRTTLERVINKLDLNMSYEALAGMVSSSGAEESRLITISVSNSDPIEAQRLNAAICEEAETVLSEMVEADLVNISESAHLPVSPYSPNVRRNVIIGIAAGILLSCAIIFVVFVVDDKIKTPADVEKQLGLSTLGLIPIARQNNAKKRDSLPQNSK